MLFFGTFAGFCDFIGKRGDIICIFSETGGCFGNIRGIKPQIGAVVKKDIRTDAQSPRSNSSRFMCERRGYFADSYATVPDISSIVPVDVYICGCPVSPIEFQSAVKSLFAAKVSEQD